MPEGFASLIPAKDSNEVSSPLRYGMAWYGISLSAFLRLVYINKHVLRHEMDTLLFRHPQKMLHQASGPWAEVVAGGPWIVEQRPGVTPRAPAAQFYKIGTQGPCLELCCLFAAVSSVLPSPGRGPEGSLHCKFPGEL